MRRTALAALLLAAFACRQERRTSEATQAPPPSSTQRTAVTSTAPAVPVRALSTPQKCAGDGSYQQAVDCFRQIAQLTFRFDEGDGKMNRPTPGAEKIDLDVRRGENAAHWTATTTAKGVVWTRDGRKVASAPPELERMFQRLTIYLDPQKKEGEPKLAGVENVEGESAKRYEFTDANNDDVYAVWVATSDGAIVRMKVNKATITFVRS